MSSRVEGRSVAVVGAGSVGSTIAYACMIRGVANNIALFDIDAAKVSAQTLDLNHGLQFVPMASVEGSDDVEICRGADVVVVTAGAKQKPGQTRMDLAAVNVELCRNLIPRLVQLSPEAILLLVTNPVDVLTYVAWRLSELPAQQVFGSGTVLDSSRFRFLLAARCGVAVQNVHAHVVGEHGDTEIPLWSSATIANVPVLEWQHGPRGPLNEADRLEIFENVRDAAYQIVRGKGATNYAVGLATARILEGVLNDEHRVLPVSSSLDGYQGVKDVCLSVPCVLNRRGVATRLAVPMSAQEADGFRHSADTVRQAIRSFGF